MKSCWKIGVVAGSTKHVPKFVANDYYPVDLRRQVAKAKPINPNASYKDWIRKTLGFIYWANVPTLKQAINPFSLVHYLIGNPISLAPVSIWSCNKNVPIDIELKGFTN